MFNQKKRWRLWAILVPVCFLTLSCSLFSGLGNTVAPTPTPTTIGGGGIVVTEQEPQNPCEGVTGKLELQLLVGPSEAVGLEPMTYAEIPFSTVVEGNSYLITSGGPVDYYEDVYEAEWGTYTVTFEGETTIQGECMPGDGTGTLNFSLEMSGEQIVEVVVEGAVSTYPWAGTPQIEASFPLEEGAQVSGEGWTLILHLN
jgi:hypothetical protein